jgi:hypothetical protein
MVKSRHRTRRWCRRTGIHRLCVCRNRTRAYVCQLAVMKKRAFTIALTAFLSCYVSGPYIAGVNRIGDRLGPVVYPRSFHELLYIMGHEGSYHASPWTVGCTIGRFSTGLRDASNLSRNENPISSGRDGTTARGGENGRDESGRRRQEHKNDG